ncbi:hypothetical protein L873DRAFT_980882 [Choiromyces venosus 120613-1]|uniref:Uncharacterized protein n=1 Tax=Choiromyces venosus 120613-1 TaxID=1336337 RepID=A0A3N4JL73_9PEZI|nr:hypothetical protein L873DRAFT_980882 [Choiromyces venosus 120613-1]
MLRMHLLEVLGRAPKRAAKNLGRRLPRVETLNISLMRAVRVSLHLHNPRNSLLRLMRGLNVTSVKKHMQTIEIEPHNSAKPQHRDQGEKGESRPMPNRSQPVVTGRSVSFLSSTQDQIFIQDRTWNGINSSPPASAPAPPPTVPPVSPRPTRCLAKTPPPKPVCLNHPHISSCPQ